MATTPLQASAQRAQAAATHTALLIETLTLLQRAQQNDEPREVIRNIASRAVESVEQISHTLDPVRRSLNSLLATHYG